jgi:osmotically-inducible protein OsmY
MRTFLVILGVIAACSGAASCTTLALGAAAGVGIFAVQDRTIGEGIDDAAASHLVKTRLLRADRIAFQEVDVEVANGNLLLSGTTPTPWHRAEAQRIAYSVDTIDRVYNELVVGQPSSLGRDAWDEIITARIRARFAASRYVNAININIETFHGNVYLMGIARSEEELRYSADLASRVRGVRRVISFMEVRVPPPPYYPNASAQYYSDATP